MRLGVVDKGIQVTKSDQTVPLSGQLQFFEKHCFSSNKIYFSSPGFAWKNNEIIKLLGL